MDVAPGPLNEGRGRNPGDTPRPRRQGQLLGTTLNEGRGRNPGDTSRAGRSRRPRPRPLNEGRGRNPGDTCRRPKVGPSGGERSTKAGAGTPATRARKDGRGRGAAPLNEGRGRNPGDTWGTTLLRSMLLAAQRRPGPEPRRHLRPVEDELHVARGRSTKAGAGTPATPGEDGVNGAPVFLAQRRPGPEPRRHLRPRVGRGEGRGAQRRPGPEPRRHGRRLPPRQEQRLRSTKAGAGTPATQVLARAPELPLARRSTKAGAGTPATQVLARAPELPLARRSTKAGAGTPATPLGVGPVDGVDRVRSTKAGAGTPATHGKVVHNVPTALPAQRRPGPEPRRHARRRRASGLCRGPLNEGRGRNPGDTSRTSDCSATAAAAQRRPGPEPRRHAHVGQPHDVERSERSTKAGAGTPATRHHADGLRDALLRSTKAGAGTPATPSAASAPIAPFASAQRRPGPEPRRHAHRMR